MFSFDPFDIEAFHYWGNKSMKDSTEALNFFAPKIKMKTMVNPYHLLPHEKPQKKLIHYNSSNSFWCFPTLTEVHHNICIPNQIFPFGFLLQKDFRK
jgi:hypothetical protein